MIIGILLPVQCLLFLRGFLKFYIGHTSLSMRVINYKVLISSYELLCFPSMKVDIDVVMI